MRPSGECQPFYVRQPHAVAGYSNDDFVHSSCAWCAPDAHCSHLISVSLLPLQSVVVQTPGIKPSLWKMIARHMVAVTGGS